MGSSQSQATIPSTVTSNSDTSAAPVERETEAVILASTASPNDGALGSGSHEDSSPLLVDVTTTPADSTSTCAGEGAIAAEIHGEPLDSTVGPSPPPSLPSLTPIPNPLSSPRRSDYMATLCAEFDELVRRPNSWRWHGQRAADQDFVAYLDRAARHPLWPLRIVVVRPPQDDAWSLAGEYYGDAILVDDLLTSYRYGTDWKVLGAPRGITASRHHNTLPLMADALWREWEGAAGAGRGAMDDEEP